MNSAYCAFFFFSEGLLIGFSRYENGTRLILKKILNIKNLRRLRTFQIWMANDPIHYSCTFHGALIHFIYYWTGPNLDTSHDSSAVTSLLIYIYIQAKHYRVDLVNIVNLSCLFFHFVN